MSDCRVCASPASELRAGVCWDCASSAESVVAARSVLGHVLSCLKHVVSRRWAYARFDAQWAWERLTRTGDYKPLGRFEREYGIRA